MDPVALAGLCALIARGPAVPAAVSDMKCPPSPMQPLPAPTALDGQDLAQRLAAPGARDGVARVAFAEAGDQGDSGLAGVVYTILNRLADGRWGDSVDEVLNAAGQFEPVMRAGGDWRRLPALSAADQARVDTILNLAVEGRLPDLTGGARYFQNPAIVAARARAGTVSQRLVNFGGRVPSAVIGAHSFFTGEGREGGRSRAAGGVGDRTDAPGLFIGENRSQMVSETPIGAPTTTGVGAGDSTAAGDPGKALFVTLSGQVRADRP